ncbi:MAG: trypsin-like serine protease [Actinobacteria bacterium]|nr:MAG: trypsin-like serine protease [Actinomycetota bacterium]
MSPHRPLLAVRAPAARARTRPPARALLAATLAAAAGGLGAGALAGCGSSSSKTSSAPSAAPPSQTTRVEAISPVRTGRFDPAAIYRREAPGVVTILSVLGGGPPGRRQGAEGSGFVISGSGEVATNAHVVTDGTGPSIHPVPEVYVQFQDGNEVPAHIVGFDADSDVALLRVSPAGLTLRSLPLGSSASLVVGSPVAAIGSPFGEAGSLSVGAISATGRAIDSLTGFQIEGAIQTDAAINHGNSGGPLIDARGAVVGINSEIAPSSSGGQGVGFAVPVDVVRRSLDQLRRTGGVKYAYLGISSATVYPQLARRFGIGVAHGAWIQRTVSGGPAQAAGLQGGSSSSEFQAEKYRTGGDVVSRLDSHPIDKADDLGQVLESYSPGQQITLEVWRGGQRRTVKVKLGERPRDTSPSSLP